MTLSKFHHDCAYAGNNLQYDFEICIRLHWRVLVVERSRFKWFKHVGLRFRRLRGLGYELKVHGSSRVMLGNLGCEGLVDIWVWPETLRLGFTVWGFGLGFKAWDLGFGGSGKSRPPPIISPATPTKHIPLYNGGGEGEGSCGWEVIA